MFDFAQFCGVVNYKKREIFVVLEVFFTDETQCEKKKMKSHTKILMVCLVG